MLNYVSIVKKSNKYVKNPKKIFVRNNIYFIYKYNICGKTFHNLLKFYYITPPIFKFFNFLKYFLFKKECEKFVYLIILNYLTECDLYKICKLYYDYNSLNYIYLKNADLKDYFNNFYIKQKKII